MVIYFVIKTDSSNSPVEAVILCDMMVRACKVFVELHCIMVMLAIDQVYGFDVSRSFVTNASKTEL